jgi:hypothetical protein
MFKWAKPLANSKFIRLAWGFAFAMGMIINVAGVGNARSADPVAQSVRNGKLEGYQGVTLGEALESFMSNVKWESLKADDGHTYVNVRGGITYYDKPVTAVVQYKMIGKTGNFEFNAFEINEVPQSVLVYNALIEKAYEEVQQKQQMRRKASGR